MTLTRRRILAASGAALALPALAQAPAGQPIRIGSTLALTGPLSATALTHKLVGEIYVEQLNKRGGLLGRRVEWIVKDDQSKPDLARTLYEQLVTTADEKGNSGDITWNFEKFLISADGEVVARFGPGTEPTDPHLVEAVEDQLG